MLPRATARRGFTRSDMDRPQVQPATRMRITGGLMRVAPRQDRRGIKPGLIVTYPLEVRRPAAERRAAGHAGRVRIH